METGRNNILTNSTVRAIGLVALGVVIGSQWQTPVAIEHEVRAQSAAPPFRSTFGFSQERIVEELRSLNRSVSRIERHLLRPELPVGTLETERSNAE